MRRRGVGYDRMTAAIILLGVAWLYWLFLLWSRPEQPLSGGDIENAIRTGQYDTLHRR